MGLTELKPTQPKTAQSEDAILLQERTLGAVLRFTEWLDSYGEVSYDFQSFYASRLGQSAKRLYYRKPHLGTLAVSPMVFCEAFIPSARRLFWKPQRFPIADAHYAMGFLLLAQLLEQHEYHAQAMHFLHILEQTRCAGYEHLCWGYPYNWETLRGTIKEGTPLITTVPYVYEAFKLAFQQDGNDRWFGIMRSIAQHALQDYKDFATSTSASTCSYTPNPEDSLRVINANAYRAFLLTSAALDFSEQKYSRVAERNLKFVIEAQNPDGSWYYAKDGQRHFIDHFHTCFVLKALAKIEMLTGDRRCTGTIERGVHYYINNLFDEHALPRPFSRPPRFIVYRRELYDYAECVNLATLLRGRFPKLDRILATVLNQVVREWQKADGSFRSRELLLGWDNTPMHRWAQAQMFRSLCFWLHATRTADVATAGRTGQVAAERPSVGDLTDTPKATTPVQASTKSRGRRYKETS